MCHRRRDRDCHVSWPRLRRAATPPAPGGLARRQAGRGDAVVFRRLRPPRRRRPRSVFATAATSAATISSGSSAKAPRRLYLTPMTRDRAIATEWLERFEGAGLDGVIAKPIDGRTSPASARCSRSSTRARPTASSPDFSWHKVGEGTVGSLLLGLYDDGGDAAPCRRDVVVHDDGAEATGGAAGAAERARSIDIRGAPGRRSGRGMARMPGAQSRWSAGKDLSWEPLRIERVCEVKYDHLQGDRFRHAARLPALASGQAAGRLPLRSARGHGALRAREGLRRGSPSALNAAQSFGACVGIERLLRGPRARRARVCRLTRIRVQVRKRPRIASTSTSAGARCGAASGCRAFHRSRPAQRVFLSFRAPDLDQRTRRARGAATAARAAARRLLPVVRRPRRIAQSVALVPRRQLEQALERAALLVDACVPVADRGESRRHRGQREVAGSQASISSQASGAETRASGVGRTE